jgi:hypothetical protein
MSFKPEINPVFDDPGYEIWSGGSGYSACWLEAALRRESAKGRGAARRDSLEEEGSQALFVAPDPDMSDLASLLYMVERTTSFICS